MFEVFCFITLFSTLIGDFFSFNQSYNLAINYIKIFSLIILLLFSMFNVSIGIYWILDLNDDWSSLTQSGFDRFSWDNPSIKSPPVRHYLIYIIPYLFLVCGIFSTLDFFKKFKKITN
jgi:hypothetical protein